MPKAKCTYNGDLSAKENVNGGTPNQAPLRFQQKYLQSTAFGGVVWGLEGRSWPTRAWIGQFLDRRPGVRLTACSTLLVPCQAPGAVPTVQKGVFERSPSFFSLTTRAAREGTPVMAGGTDEETVIRCHIVPSGCTGCCGIQADHVASKLTIFSRKIT